MLFIAKIYNDKYYTSLDLARYCINKTYEIIKLSNITEIIEPSAGNGSFSNQIESCITYDIEPEHSSIIKQDYLELEIDYKKGRLIIGNPPFGEKLNMAQKFFKKSIQIADYIAFILPIGQLNNTNSLYEFDLIHSEDLGKQIYTDRQLHCCFNIYQRPKNGLNKKQSNKLKDITIVRQDSKSYHHLLDYDLRMCYWGNGTAGKVLKDGEHYSAEYKIIIHNKTLREKIIHTLENVNWHKELNKVAMLKIQQFHIYNVLKKYIKEIN